MMGVALRADAGCRRLKPLLSKNCDRYGLKLEKYTNIIYIVF